MAVWVCGWVRIHVFGKSQSMDTISGYQFLMVVGLSWPLFILMAKIGFIRNFLILRIT